MPLFGLERIRRRAIAGGLLLGCVCFVCAGSPASAQDLEIRVSQSKYIFAHEARQPGNGYGGANGFFDLIAPNIAIINNSPRDVVLDEAWIELSANGSLLERSYIRKDEIEAARAAYARYTQLHFPLALNVELAADTILPDGVAPSESSLNIHPGTALLASDNYVLTRGLPDTLTVTARGHTGDGREVTGRMDLLVLLGRTKNQYEFPLQSGAWYVIGYPGIDSHHRFTQATEFAMDITRVDSLGRWFKAKGRRWADWYAYDKKVLAAASGVVIGVRNDSNLDPAIWRPQDTESPNHYQERLDTRQLQRFLASGADPSEVAGGNSVTIAHANGEYSHYAHLAFGSVQVHVGDHVDVGQYIARVGGTGEAPVVHLHFEVTDSADTRHFAFHSFPVEFGNVAMPANARQSSEHGFFVVAKSENIAHTP